MEEGSSLRESVQYNPRKFREILVYVAERTSGDARFGDVKINKVLWWADFRAYNELGHAITGARYQKLPLGPAARAFVPVREELETEGALRVSHRWSGMKRQTVTEALRPADTSFFSADELALVDEIIEWLGPKSADRVSDLSHEKSPGWNLVELREDIPYATSLIATDPPSPRMVARGRELAERFGW